MNRLKERGEGRRGEGRSEPSETQKKKRVVGLTLPLTPHLAPPQKTHRASGWPHRAQGQR